ncbi:MAG: type I methionyl aminopeptidase [Ignavibacteria bacterium]|nr:MAG: type I methionyl aminopeptidase [Ignavibacteria bacterium]
MILIKSKKEIDFIRESCKIVAETLQMCKAYAKEGVTTGELDKIAEDYIRSNDAIPAFKGYSQGNAPGFPGTICASVNEEVVHGIPGNRVLKNGDIISIDVGVLKNKYYGDAALTVAIGEISEEKKRLMEVTEKSLYKGIEAAVAGNRIGDISYAVQEFVESNGFSIVRELCGHGVGRYLHEEPQIPNFGPKGKGPVIKNGMTLAIEPMVNAGKHFVDVAKDGWTVFASDRKPSAHFEHSIAIIDGKPEILTVA